MLRRSIAGALESPVLRWSWAPISEHQFSVPLGDFRTADVDSVTEMAAGRYLLGGKMVDTNGMSPFAVEVDHFGWKSELNSFSWLRHFTELKDDGLRRFARTLVLDWIGRNSRSHDPEVWSVALTAQRALNWMRHITLLTQDASAGQQRLINRSLGRQVRSLRLRAPHSPDPLDRLLTAMAQLAAGLCENRPTEFIAERLVRLEQQIELQFGAGGLHRSRSAAIQVEVLTGLVTLRQAMARRDQVHMGTLPTRIAAMHAALAKLTLGTGGLGYFNGTGQVPSDLVLALQAAGGPQRPEPGIFDHYGRLQSDGAVLIADSGHVPEPKFARWAHAGGMSFEFSHMNELIVGNCGPAPAELREQSRLFRLGAAHCAPTIDRKSQARVISRGPATGILVSDAPQPEIEFDAEEQMLKVTSHAYERGAGVMLERWLTLLMGGDAVVGQDRITAANTGITGEEITMRFHLGPGVEAEHEPGEDIIKLTLPSGGHWSFLWEGAEAEIDDSVRQSAYFGFYRTRQIVLSAPLSDGREIAWILTRLT